MLDGSDGFLFFKEIERCMTCVLCSSHGGLESHVLRRSYLRRTELLIGLILMIIICFIFFQALIFILANALCKRAHGTPAGKP